MCPNCMMNLTVVLGGAGSAALVAAAGLRLRAFRPRTPVTDTEEIES